MKRPSSAGVETASAGSGRQAKTCKPRGHNAIDREHGRSGRPAADGVRVASLVRVGCIKVGRRSLQRNAGAAYAPVIGMTARMVAADRPCSRSMTRTSGAAKLRRRTPFSSLPLRRKSAKSVRAADCKNSVGTCSSRQRRDAGQNRRCRDCRALVQSHQHGFLRVAPKWPRLLGHPGCASRSAAFGNFMKSRPRKPSLRPSRESFAVALGQLPLRPCFKPAD